jgi:ankyrin repeat protein
LERTFTENNVGIAYIFCNYKDPNQTLINLVASLLQQLVQAKSDISDDIITLYESHVKKRTRPSLAEYSQILRSEILHFSKIFIVIDALDECRESNSTRETLLTIIETLRPTVHLLVTARPHITDVINTFQDAVTLEIRARDEDIQKYVHSRLLSERRLQSHVKNDRDLHNAIITTIVGNVKGMSVSLQYHSFTIADDSRFLLAQLHMDALSKKLRKRDVRLALQNLPQKLDDTYDEAMKRIWSQDPEEVELAEQVLAWISYAKRPLTVTELQHALAITPESSEIDEEAITDEEFLLSVCAGLVTIDQEGNIIRLVHYTTQEYFERVRESKFPNTEITIAATCITYMSLVKDIPRRIPEYEKSLMMMEEYPLLRYAVQYWGVHAQGPGERIIQPLILKFLAHESRLFLADPSRGSLIQLPGLCLAAAFGLDEILDNMLQSDINLAVTDNKGQNSLHYAAMAGNESVVRLFLKKGIKVNSRTKNGSSALHFAVGSEHESVAIALLENGADVHARDKAGSTVLLFAVKARYKPIIQLLLKKGANVDTQDDRGRTVLHSAVWDGAEDIVQLLLQMDAKVDAHDVAGETPLHFAAKKGDNSMARLLLGNGALVDTRSKNGRTALHFAVRAGHELCVRLLLDEGSNVNSQDNDGETALHYAAAKGYDLVARLLLENGVLPSAQAKNGETALHCATSNGKTMLVQLLLDIGADVNTSTKVGATALHYAARNGEESVARMLLANGAHIEKQDRDGRTALHIAVRNRHELVTKLLLENGANVKAQTKKGQMAIYFAERGTGVWNLLAAAESHGLSVEPSTYQKT